MFLINTFSTLSQQISFTGTPEGCQYVADPKVNGTPAETLPSELPDEDGDFIIEFEPDDTEVTE